MSKKPSMARVKISHQLKKRLHNSTHHHLLREFLIILILTLLVTSGWLPINFFKAKDSQALNQLANWAFTGNSTGWTLGNGTGTNTCGDNGSATTYSFATFAYYSNDFRAVTSTTAGRDYRGNIRQTFVAPGSGNVNVKGRFKYTTSATSWAGGSGWVRLDIYDSTNTTFIGSLSCVTFSSSLTNKYSSYAGDVVLSGGTTYTARLTIKATRPTSYNATIRVDEVVVNAAPVGLTASAPADTTSAQLNWTASTGGSGANALHASTPYKVYRNTVSPVTTSNFFANSNTNSYTDSTTSPRTTYYYAVTNYDTGSYESPLSNEVSVKTRPAAPGAISFSNVTSSAMRVSWSAPSGGADSYKVERCQGSGCSNFSEIATGVTNTYYDDSGLSSGTIYRYRIRATDTVSGDGGYNTPDEQSTSSSVSVPTVTTQAASSINYNAATGNGSVSATGGENPTRYIQWGTTVAYGSSCSAGVGGAGAYSCAISSLSPNTLYHVRAYATNSAGTGYGTDSTFTTLPGTPGTISFSNITSSAMRVTWSAPSGGADSYKVERCQGTGCSSYGEIATGVTNTYYDDSGLSSNTIYRYRIRATNTTGDGAYNTPDEQATTAATPTVTTQAASSINYNAATGNGSVSATGGENPTRYIQWGTTVAYGSSCSAGVGGAGAYSCAISSLSPNTLYHVRAYATNSGGTGYGMDGNFTTLPGAPTISGGPFSNVGSSTLRFTWTAPSGGADSYKVERCQGASCSSFSEIATGVTNAYYDDSGLSSNTIYRYRVRATNTTGDGAYSSSTGDQLTLPGTPGIISFSNVTSSAMRVSWSAPVGGAASYKVERCQGTGCSGFSQIATGETNTYYDDSGLSGSTVYRYRIRATNTTGDGAYNTPDEQSTSGSVSAPTTTTQTASSINYNAATGNGTVTATGGENPTRYIQWGTTVAYGSSCSAGSGSTGAYSCAISSLSPNTLYHVRAYATNSAGTGYGNDSTFTTLPGSTSLPGTPISNVSSLSMRFSWTAPSGGADSYKVERCQGASCSSFGQIASGVTNTYYDDSGLTGNTIYRYRAKATNTSGDGAYSNATSDQLTYPDVPSSITFSNVSTSTMRVNWSAPGGGAASYKVERCQGSGCSNFGQIATGVTNTYYDDSGLSPDTIYRYRARATNSMGDSSYSTAAERLTSGSGGATSENNIRGNAYNATYGKISFNCLDDGTGGHFPYAFPFPFSTEPCNPNTHGVNLDENNNFAGEAWNATLGLITFNATTTPPDNYAFNTNCPSTCNLGNECWACYNENDQKIYGWARVINGGQWIQFNSSLSPQSSMNNYLSPNPGIFSGYASSSFGSISLNCLNDNSCLSDDYKVYRWPIEIRQLSAPNWAFSEACSSGARQAVLKWYVNSGAQSAYQVIINNANNTTSPIYDSGKTTGSAKQFICNGGACSLDYNEHYYFWLRLWDESYTATPTPWRQFNTSAGDTLTDNVAENSSSQNPNLTFTTYKHEFPMPYFSWSPFDVIVGSTTSFTNSSQYYNSTYPNYNPQVCSAGTCYYLWTTTDAGAMIASSTAATTSIVFTKATGTRVYLKTTDADNYFCSTSTLLNVNFLLPTWKEVKATSTGN